MSGLAKRTNTECPSCGNMVEGSTCVTCVEWREANDSRIKALETTLAWQAEMLQRAKWIAEQHKSLGAVDVSDFISDLAKGPTDES